MIGKTIGKTLLILAIGLAQFSLVSVLPYGLANLNLPLVALVFILLSEDLSRALLWSAVIGLFLDLLSFSPFGLFLLCLPLAVAAADWFLTNLFTNRSAYTFFSLTVITVILFEIFSAVYLWLWTNQSGYATWSAIWQTGGEKLLFNLVLTGVVFYFSGLVSNRFRPAILSRKNL